MEPTLDVTAVRWFWHDGEDFKPFDAIVNNLLEKKYLDLTAIPNPIPDQLRISVDGTRFIDFNFKNELDIKRHFRGLDDEVGLVGLQRRYDDPMKRRAVKRDVSMFAGWEVVRLGWSANPRVDALITAAVTASAAASSLENTKWTPKTVAIASADFTGPRDGRMPPNVAITSAEWILECIAQGKVVPLAPFALIVAAPELPAAATPQIKRRPSDGASTVVTPQLVAKKTRVESPLQLASSHPPPAVAGVAEVAALPVQVSVGTLLAGLCLKVAASPDEEDEPSLHCSVVFTSVETVDLSGTQRLAGLMTWATDGIVTHRTLFSGKIEQIDAKKRIIRLSEESILQGDGKRMVFEGRVGRGDCRLFSADRMLQLALMPVPSDRNSLVGSISYPAILQITHNTPPTFRGLLVQPHENRAEIVAGSMTTDELTFDGPTISGKLTLGDGPYEGLLKIGGISAHVRLQVFGS